MYHLRPQPVPASLRIQEHARTQAFLQSDPDGRPSQHRLRDLPGYKRILQTVFHLAARRRKTSLSTEVDLRSNLLRLAANVCSVAGE